MYLKKKLAQPEICLISRGFNKVCLTARTDLAGNDCSIRTIFSTKLLESFD